MVTNLLLFNCLNLRYGGTTVNFKLLKKNETLLGKRVILFMKNDSLSSPSPKSQSQSQGLGLTLKSHWPPPHNF